MRAPRSRVRSTAVRASRRSRRARPLGESAFRGLLGLLWLRGGSTEAAAHVVERARVVGLGEDLVGRSFLDDAAGLVLAGEEERAVLQHALRLLHVVRDDD